MSKSKYNIRDAKGKFVKLVSTKVCKCGGNCPKIVAGRLYDFKGVTVRAFGTVGNKRFVAAHKVLTGLVDESELKPTTKQAVENYLARA